jgi:flagellar hook-associated protein 3 FlgL
MGDTAAFAVTTDSSGQVTGATYQGNTSLAQSEIALNVTVSAQALGANTSSSGPRGLITDSGSGADFLAHLISLRDHLQAGDTAAIAATDRAQLAADEDNILYHVTANGALQARLEATSNLASQHSLALAGQISVETDADMAQTLTQFSQTQTAYQAALQSGAAMMNLSLLDFLR